MLRHSYVNAHYIRSHNVHKVQLAEVRNKVGAPKVIIKLQNLAFVVVVQNHFDCVFLRLDFFDVHKVVL